MKKNKLIIGIDHKLWSEFTFKCRIEGVKVTDKLSDLIKSEINDNNKKFRGNA